MIGTIIFYIVLGLVAGAIARAIMPGTQNTGSWLINLILGIVGAFVGGFLGNLIFHGKASLTANAKFFDPATWIMAIVGCVVVLALYGFLARRGHSTTTTR